MTKIRRTLTGLLALGFLAGAWGCGSPGESNLISFLTLYWDCCTNGDGADFNVVIDDQAALDALWADYALAGSAPTPDFALYTVVACFTDGYCAACCATESCGATAKDFDVMVERAKSGACITAYVARLIPSELDACATPTNARVHVVRLPKADCVTFEERTVTL